MLVDWELGNDVTGLDVLRLVRPLQRTAQLVVVSGNERELSPAIDDELVSLGLLEMDWWPKPARTDAVQKLVARIRGATAGAAGAAGAGAAAATALQPGAPATAAASRVSPVSAPTAAAPAVEAPAEEAGSICPLS